MKVKVKDTCWTMVNGESVDGAIFEALLCDPNVRTMVICFDNIAWTLLPHNYDIIEECILVEDKPVKEDKSLSEVLKGYSKVTLEI